MNKIDTFLCIFILLAILVSSSKIENYSNNTAVVVAIFFAYYAQAYLMAYNI